MLDLSWVGVGPMTAGYLAVYGATVIKVESSKRPDVLRLTNPFRDGKPGINNSHFYGDFNPDKLGVGIDLTNQRGREIAWKADRVGRRDRRVVHAQGARRLGHGLRRDRRTQPVGGDALDLHAGPDRSASVLPRFRQPHGRARRLLSVTGWPDRDPVMIYGAYTDFLSQRFAATALIAALDHRRRTGEGQHIDLSPI